MNLNPDYKIRPVTKKEWQALEILFTSLPAANMCWCMYWRETRAKVFGHPQENKAGFKAIIDSGKVPGLLAYQNDEPIGWCSIAPRDEFPGLDRSPTLKRIDDLPVWSLNCFVIAKAFRRQGLSSQLIFAAIDYAKRNGARIIEAYPFDNPSGKYRMVGESFLGFSTTFKRLGFAQASFRSRVRNIYRLNIT